ncbi:unnamed protein product [Phaedon cochleariae]|uniref:Major facilitator superfamily (MFS) profile domain-containing protein n=1 Tax=Phaedon cochleariae TaxID=80249 RepID=A0A9N9X1V0_PHACE|nr:unnamed protein product [Phaedon cochleariae]
MTSEHSHVETTKREAEMLETDMMIGVFCGLPLTIYLVDKIGRKRLLLVAGCIALAGWITVAAANKMVYFHVARFFFGITANMCSVAAPMYVAEIAESNIRGFLSSTFNFMMAIGLLIMYAIAPFTPFYTTSIIGILICTLELVILFSMPESPYYLLYINENKKAKESLEYFRMHREVDKELREMMKAVERQKCERGRIQDLVLVRSNRKAMLVMTILNVGQNMVAISVILMNLHPILESAGSIYMSSSVAAILFAVITLISAYIASLQVDKYGRKALLLISSILSSLSLLSIAIYFHLKNNNFELTSVSWLPTAALMVYAATFKLGLGIVPVVMSSELFSAKVKALGMSFADIMYVIGGIFSIQLYVWLSSWFGLHVPLYVFTVSGFVLALFVVCYIPETKGKTLEEIQYILKGEEFFTNALLSQQEDYIL